MPRPGRAVKPLRKLRPGRSAAYRVPMGRALEARSRAWQRGGGIAGCQRRLAKRYVIEKSSLLSTSRISAGVAAMASSSPRHWPFERSSAAGEFDGAHPTRTSDLTTPRGALGAQQTDRSSASRVLCLEARPPLAGRSIRSQPFTGPDATWVGRAASPAPIGLPRRWESKPRRAGTRRHHHVAPNVQSEV
jgi:hypothetical protein